MKIQDYRPLTQNYIWEKGVSYQAKDLINNHNVELRIYQRSKFTDKLWHNLTKLFLRISMLDHPLAIKVYDIKDKKNPPYAILERAPEENLQQFLKKQPITLEHRFILIKDIVDVVNEAHRLGIVHGRLCPNEIFVIDKQIKLDFSRFYDQQQLSEQDYFFISKSTVDIPDMAVDIYSIGTIALWLLTEKAFALGPLDQLSLTHDMLATEISEQMPTEETFCMIQNLIEQTLSTDPLDRPTAEHLKKELDKILKKLQQKTGESWGSSEYNSAQTCITEGDPGIREIGRFTIIDKLGEGGMSMVYKGEDKTDGTIVAIKMILPNLINRPGILQRFLREAKLLAKVNNPYVANLLEINQDQGVHYIVMDFVAGISVEQLIQGGKKLTETQALVIMADVARALLEAHEKGIVHRDIKPANILLANPDAKILSANESTETIKKAHEEIVKSNHPYAKLSDFGLARHVMTGDSVNLTQAGAILGTPLYMSPEQCIGDQVDPRTDIYAMGATLFHLLAGATPFVSESPLVLINKHCNEDIPSIKSIRPELSDGIVRLVEKSLAKKPDMRYSNAHDFLRDAESLLHGEPTEMVGHPKLPTAEQDKLLHFQFEWKLKSSNTQLWPYVANTDRLNRALDLPAVEYKNISDPEKGLVRVAKTTTKGGMLLEWEEQPFEWIEGQRLSVFRQYSKGVFQWLASIVEMKPMDGGTLLTHSFKISPSNTLAKWAIEMEFKMNMRRSLTRVYQKIDDFIVNSTPNTIIDPFEKTKALSGNKQQFLDKLVQKVINHDIDPALAEVLGNYLAIAPDQEVARIRPLALARRLGLDHEQLISACLTAAKEGLLILLWDILCPLCRIPSELQDTLQSLQDHGHCEACNLDFDLDFANSVELIFRIHPTIRDSELRTYCVGSPAHSPHVVGQITLKPQERVELDMALAEGAYILRSQQLSNQIRFHVEPDAPVRRWDLNLASGFTNKTSTIIKTEHQVVSLRNDFNKTLTIRIERTISRRDTLTAAYASSLPLFRKLFPGEILSPKQLVAVSNVTLLATRLCGTNELYEQKDSTIFQIIYEHFQNMEQHIQKHHGAIVKTLDEGVLAVFNVTSDALEAALNIPKSVSNQKIYVVIHRGPAMVATINSRLDYFGTTIKAMNKLLSLCEEEEIILSNDIATDPDSAVIMREKLFKAKIFQSDLPGNPGIYLFRAPLIIEK